MATSAPWHQPHPHTKAPGPPKKRDPFYGTARWLRFRGWVLNRQPLCADPFGYHDQDGVAVPAKEVHHLIPYKQRPDLALSESNVQALCRSCHSRITHGGQGG